MLKFGLSDNGLPQFQQHNLNSIKIFLSFYKIVFFKRLFKKLIGFAQK